MIRTEIIGLDELQRQLGAILDGVEAGRAVALLAGGYVLVDGVKGKIAEQGLVDTGELIGELVDAEADSEDTVIVREGPRADIFAHEYGLNNQPITPRQRAFFWAKYSETNDDKWKALALSATYTIPARPHFRPGVRQAQGKAAKAIAAKAARILKQSAGG